MLIQLFLPSMDNWDSGEVSYDGKSPIRARRRRAVPYPLEVIENNKRAFDNGLLFALSTQTSKKNLAIESVGMVTVI